MVYRLVSVNHDSKSTKKEKNMTFEPIPTLLLQSIPLGIFILLKIVEKIKERKD